MRVALLPGCAQQVLRANIHDATIRLLQRIGCEVVVPPRVNCCGALSHHLGQEDHAKNLARNNIQIWAAVIEGEGLDAVVANASGCGTMIKDYGFLFADDPDWADRAQAISARAQDVSEIVESLGLPPVTRIEAGPVAHHAACSLVHGQGVTTAPRSLLEQAGFNMMEPPANLRCCGSAGTYNIMEPTISQALLVDRISAPDIVEAGIVASDNIGCLTQLARGVQKPVVHTIELLDWATGGPKPPGIAV